MATKTISKLPIGQGLHPVVARALEPFILPPLSSEQLSQRRLDDQAYQYEIDRIARRDRRWTDAMDIFAGTPSGSQA